MPENAESVRPRYRLEYMPDSWVTHSDVWVVVNADTGTTVCFDPSREVAEAEMARLEDLHHNDSIE